MVFTRGRGGYMLLESLSVQNYRCFEHLTDLPLVAITAFIGPNDSGKSSLIHLLRHCFADEGLQPADFRYSNSPVVVEMRFVVKRASEAENAQPFMLSERQLVVRKRFFKAGSRPVTEVYRTAFDDERLNRLATLRLSELSDLISEMDIPGRFKSNEERVRAIEASVASSSPSKSPHWVGADDGINRVLPEFLVFGADEDLNLQTGPLVTTLRQVYKRIVEQQPHQVVELLRDAREALDGEIATINPVIAEFLPGGSTLVVEPRLDISNSLNLGEIRIRNADGEIQSFARCGDGTKRRIMLGLFQWANDVLTKIAEEEQRSLLWGFDEPDTHLHYQAQYDLLAKLRKMADGPMQILLCTHSIPIIDRLPAHVVRHMVPDRTNQTTSVEYIRGGKDEAQFLRSVGHGLGFPNSLLFYERCFVLVEGPTEEKALPMLYQTAYGTSLLDDGIQLFAAEGAGAVLQLARLLYQHNREVIILLDNDMQGEHEVVVAVQRLSELGLDTAARIVYVGNSEFEDAFSDDVIAECLKAYRPRVDQRPWGDADIAAFRSPSAESEGKFSNDLLRKGVGPASRQRLTKPEFGRLLGEHATADFIPSQLRHLFEVARSVAQS